MASAAVDRGVVVNSQQHEIVRPTSKFTPSMWGDLFISHPFDNEAWEAYSQEVEKLKAEVKKMLVAKESNTRDRLILIDTLERLGVSYHFEEEIEEQLKQIFELADFVDSEGHDVYVVALKFRLLRQHGYRIPNSIFEKFKGEDNQFKNSLKNDIEGLLSLYEASHLRIKGEEILDEALAFTITHLERISPDLGSPLKEKVMHALEQPLHKGMERIEARHYISIYEKEDSRNDLLLRFAKVDFNLVQMLYQKELKEVASWWNELEVPKETPYVRDRAVECHFWALAVFFEPKYSLGRINVAKVLSTIAIVDDTYDSYGRLDELQLLTEAIQRWDISEAERLPGYMKRFYGQLLDLYNGFDEECGKQGRPYAADLMKERLKEIVRCYWTEATWFFGKQVPTFDEYRRNGFGTSCYPLMSVAGLMSMESARDEVFQWHSSNPILLRAVSDMGRFRNDVASCEREEKREEHILAIESYMAQHGASKEAALEKFLEISENAWREANEELLKPTAVARKFLMRVFNIGRVTDVSYKRNTDGFTYPEQIIKRQLHELFVEPLVL